MKASIAVAGLSRETTPAPARDARGGRKIGKALPTTLALRRKRYPNQSDYPYGALETRGSSHCL